MKCVSFGLITFLCVACIAPRIVKGQEYQVSQTTMADGKTWTTRNLDFYVEGSYCPENDSLLCQEFGRLYTWRAATEVCTRLGKGWVLPTDNDWKTLTKAYGGIVGESSDGGLSAYNSLITGGSSSFNALLAGNREPNSEFKRFRAHGFYWTSTSRDSTEAWFYNFAKSKSLINRHTGDKKRAVSVRCIRSEEKIN